MDPVIFIEKNKWVIWIKMVFLSNFEDHWISTLSVIWMSGLLLHPRSRKRSSKEIYHKTIGRLAGISHLLCTALLFRNSFIHQGLPRCTRGKNLACQCRKHKRYGSIPGSGILPGGGACKPIPNILAWRIPWTEEPHGLQSKGSQRVGHNWVTE